MRLFSLGKNEGGAPWRRRCVYIYCKYERRSCEVIMRLGVLRPFVRRPVIHFFPFMRGKNNGRRRVGCSILISSLRAKATWIQLTPHSLLSLGVVTHIMYADVTQNETEGGNISLPENASLKGVKGARRMGIPLIPLHVHMQM